MFKSLKEKLKNWITKNEEEPEEAEELTEKIDELKEEKKKRKRKEKKKTKEGKKVSRKNSKKELDELKETKELTDEIEEEKEIKPKKKLFGGKILTEEKLEEMFEELEMILLTNNVAYPAVDSIKENLLKNLVGKNIKSVNLAGELRKSIEELLINPTDFVRDIKNSLKEKSPYVILFFGINGAGKTTSIAKVANLLKKEKLSCVVVAADTFRAAAIQQLEEHANKLEVPIVKKDYGADPASVGFDGIRYAQKNKIDVVLIDTAGRLQNRDTLMKEIEKISRVCKPDMKIFLGESITGNDATEQAKVFNETVGIDGIILSKADVDEKGGTAISVASVTGKPILFLGTGQGYDDLEVFDKKKIIEQLGL